MSLVPSHEPRTLPCPQCHAIMFEGKPVLVATPFWVWLFLYRW